MWQTFSLHTLLLPATTIWSNHFWIGIFELYSWNHFGILVASNVVVSVKLFDETKIQITFVANFFFAHSATTSYHNRIKLFLKRHFWTLQLKPFGIIAASNVVISVKFFTEKKTSFAARMPNGFYFIRFYDFMKYKVKQVAILNSIPPTILKCA